MRLLRWLEILYYKPKKPSRSPSSYDAKVKLQRYEEAETQCSVKHAAKTSKHRGCQIDHAQRSQKECYDLKHGAASCYGVCFLDLKRDFPGRTIGEASLSTAGKGPYVITASLGKTKECNGEKVCCVAYMNSMYMHANTESTVVL